MSSTPSAWSNGWSTAPATRRSSPVPSASSPAAPPTPRRASSSSPPVRARPRQARSRLSPIRRRSPPRSSCWSRRGTPAPAQEAALVGKAAKDAEIEEKLLRERLRRSSCGKTSRASSGYSISMTRWHKWSVFI